jgi:TolB-like protein
MRVRRLLILAAGVALPTMVGSVGQEGPKTVAVLRFENNSGDARYDNLGRALSSMMISDLSVVEGIQLVERERLEEVMAELDFQQSAYVDPSSAQTLGQVVGAEFVVTGAFMTLDPDMLLDTRVARVSTAEIVKATEVSGPADQFFDLQQKLADQLLDGLAVALTAEDRERLTAQQRANRIGDLRTAVAFSEALCLLDYGAYPEALERLQDVREAAPGSQIVGVTLDLLRDRVERDAKDRLADRAGRALGGLLGKKAPPRREVRPPAC